MQIEPRQTTPFIVHGTDESFEREVKQSEIPVVVDFWASWCAPCRYLAKSFEEIAPEFEGKVKIVKMDVDANPKVAGEFGIQSIPTMVFFRDGEIIGALPGALPTEGLRELFQRHVSGELTAS